MENEAFWGSLQRRTSISSLPQRSSKQPASTPKSLTPAPIAPVSLVDSNLNLQEMLLKIVPPAAPISEQVQQAQQIQPTPDSAASPPSDATLVSCDSEGSAHLCPEGKAMDSGVEAIAGDSDAEVGENKADVKASAKESREDRLVTSTDKLELQNLSIEDGGQIDEKTVIGSDSVSSVTEVSTG